MSGVHAHPEFGWATAQYLVSARSPAATGQLHRSASCCLHDNLATRFAPAGPLADNDLDVMPKRVEKLHELVRREPVKFATDQSGDLRLIDAEHLGGGNLRQSVPFDDLRDAQPIRLLRAARRRSRAQDRRTRCRCSA